MWLLDREFEYTLIILPLLVYFWYQRSFRPDSVQIGRANSNRTIEEASDLGPMVTGQFVVRNFGPSEIPTVQLSIFWPTMFDSSENFILYPSMILSDSRDVSM